MPLDGTGATSNATQVAYLAAGKKPCIGVQLVNKVGNTPAHIVFTQEDTNKKSGVCQQVLESEPVAAYFKSKVDGTEKKMAVGSSKGIYKSVTKPEPSSS